MAQAEIYLLTAQRYIELNPVRAAMVDDPALTLPRFDVHNNKGARI